MENMRSNHNIFDKNAEEKQNHLLQILKSKPERVPEKYRMIFWSLVTVVALIVFTTVMTLSAVTIVSWLPVRKLAKLKPTDALRGRMS